MTTTTHERPGLPQRVALAGIAYLGSLLLATVASGPSARTDVRTAGYFPR